MYVIYIMSDRVMINKREKKEEKKEEKKKKKNIMRKHIYTQQISY